MIVALRKLSCRKESCEDPTEPTNDEDEAEGRGGEREACSLDKQR